MCQISFVIHDCISVKLVSMLHVMSHVNVNVIHQYLIFSSVQNFFNLSIQS